MLVSFRSNETNYHRFQLWYNTYNMGNVLYIFTPQNNNSGYFPFQKWVWSKTVCGCLWWLQWSCANCWKTRQRKVQCMTAPVTLKFRWKMESARAGCLTLGLNWKTTTNFCSSHSFGHISANDFFCPTVWNMPALATKATNWCFSNMPGYSRNTSMK